MSIAAGEKQRDLEDLETVQFVASALFDVSAEKIGRLRAAFEKNGLFYNDITDLYESVKHTALMRGELPTSTAGKMRRALVAFTSNVRFYGSVNTDVMLTFLERFEAEPDADVIIIGRTGKMFMESSEEVPHGVKITYLSFEADEPTKIEMQQFLDSVAAYDEVHVFYPSFVSVFSQQVASVDIAHMAEEAHMTPAPEHAKGEEIDYIFEPELRQILGFFETRVRYLLFQRVALESELARTAARLFAMNRAQDQAEEEVVKVQRAIRKDVDSFNDARLLESFAAISKWKTT